MWMAKPTSPVLLLAALFAAGPVAAESLRCRVVNGNAVCAGSGAMSCQTINGRTTCLAGDGAVVQQFRSQQPPRLEAPPEAAPEPDELETEEAVPPPPRGRSLPSRRMQVERLGPAGHWLSLQRDGSRLRLNTDRLSVELD
jgi:hypothetical protein